MGVSKIRSVYVATEATFGADPSANGAGYRFIHASDISPSFDFGEAIERTVQDDTLDHPGTIIGAQGGSISFKTELRGPGLANAAVSGSTAKHSEMGLSLKAAFGGVRLGVGTTFSAGWTTTTGAVAAATGINVGDVIYRIVNGRPEARAVTNKAGSNITVSPAWSSMPAASDVCYAMANYTAYNAGHETEAIVLKGDDFEHVALGCSGNVALEALTARGIGRLAFDYVVDSIDHLSAKASLPAALDTYPNPPVVKRAPCWINGTQTLITELSFALGNDRQPKLSTEGTQGRAGYTVAGQAKEGSVKVYYASGLIGLYKAATKFPLFFFMEDGIGNVVALYLPAAQIVASPNVEDNSGHNGQTLQIRACKPATGGAAVTLAIG